MARKITITYSWEPGIWVARTSEYEPGYLETIKRLQHKIIGALKQQ